MVLGIVVGILVGSSVLYVGSSVFSAFECVESEFFLVSLCSAAG